ncbi:peroxidase [Alphaproteobacteria bacterium 46_93_T64]|nr:peroxidase [Alphaproteobacteria bacterium 46_93_T64]
MPFIPDFPENATLGDVFTEFPTTSKPLLDFHEVLLRGPSPFTIAERELIAAYVSGLNACSYCHGIHTKTAEAFGLAEGVLEALLEDISQAPIDEKMKPVLRYVGKLTREPAKMVQADADTVFDAGWDKQALHDAVAVCALFNFMNRLVEGMGLKGTPRTAIEGAQRLKGLGYAGLSKALGL